jgi:hypothetical protein
MKFIVVEPHEDVPIQLTIGILSHAIVITTLVPPHLRGNPPKPLRGATIAFVQLVISYFRPYMRPLKYHEYKKGSYMDVHIKKFIVTIKANGEMINEEITNMFNIKLKDNASDWCNNYMKNHPHYRIVDLEHAFCKHYMIVYNDEQMYLQLNSLKHETTKKVHVYYERLLKLTNNLHFCVMKVFLYLKRIVHY